MKNKIIITGASGFSGNNILQSLKKKFNLIGIYSRSYKKGQKNYKIDLTKKITNLYADWIIHTASHHKIVDFKRQPITKYQNNIKMIKNLILLCRSKNIRNFVFFSTIDISYNFIPKNKKLYIRSKVNCEKLLNEAYKKKYFDKLYILRLPAIIGKNSNDNFIIDTFKKLKRNQEIKIWNYNTKYNNFIHISDITRLLQLLISIRKKNDRKIINCLVSKPTKLEKIITLMKKRLKSKSPIKKIKNQTPVLSLNKKFRSDQFNYKFFSSTKTISKFVKENRNI